MNDIKENINNTFTFIDLFSGIGGFRIALEAYGGQCLGFSEIDKTAIHTYKNNFNTKDEWELGNIRDINYNDLLKKCEEKNQNIDIVTGGVPCQSWSVAGKKGGFSDPRGALWFDTINFVKKLTPKVFIFENVKGLADPRNKANLNLIIKEFHKINYHVFYKVLNGFHFGLPQNRERIFIVGIRKDLNKGFSFPDNYTYLPVLKAFLDNIENSDNKNIIKSNNRRDINDKNKKEFLSESHKYLKNAFNMSAITNKRHFFTFCDTRNGENTIHSWDILKTSSKQKDICLTLLKNRRKKIYGSKDGNPLSFNDLNKLIDHLDKKDLDNLIDKKILVSKNNKYDFYNSKNSSGVLGIYRLFLPSSHVFSTLTKIGSKDFISEKEIPENTIDRKKYVIENIFNSKEYRKISKTEALRIQGFPDDYKLPDNYQKSMGLLGNALCINIVKEIIKELNSQVLF